MISEIIQEQKKKTYMQMIVPSQILINNHDLKYQLMHFNLSLICLNPWVP